MLDLETKIKYANELREMLEGVREHELAPSFGILITTILQFLRSTQPSFRRDSHEHQLRRVLLEIIQRLPSGEALRQYVPPIMSCVLYLMKTDNEDLAVTSSKIVMDYVRTYKMINEETIAEITSIFQQIFGNAQAVVEEFLSENSVALDSNTTFPSVRSFKLLSELGTLMAVLVSVNRAATSPHLQNTAESAVKIISVEAPAQKKSREDVEAMGGVWAGMAPTIKNVGVYYDFINAQIRVRNSAYII
jgi:transformation/transcription domain-associated protein